MSEPYELRSINPGINGPNDPEGPTCECGNVLPVGDHLAPCASAMCRKLGCGECQVRCEVCTNWFCKEEITDGICHDELCEAERDTE